jgi:hypothetical protein
VGAVARLDRRHGSPGLNRGVNSRHLLVCQVQTLVPLWVVPLLLVILPILRERLLLDRTVLL